MNVLTSILTVAAFGFGAISVYLYSQLDAARSEAASQTAPCRDEHAQIGVLQRTCVAFEPDAMRSEGLSAEDREDDSVEPVIGRLIPDTRVSQLGAREFQATPAGREFSRARQEAALRRMYGGIGEDLNLSPDQETDLMALLLQQLTEQSETTRALAGNRAAMTSAMNDLQSKNSTELMAALGDKYLQFEDHQKTLGERMQIEQAALQLEAAGVPLKEEQQRKLLELMVDERERMPRPTWTAGMPPERTLAQQREWQDDYEQRLRGRLSGILTSEQLKQYDVFLNLQATQRRRQFETWRESSRQKLGLAPSNAM